MTYEAFDDVVVDVPLGDDEDFAVVDENGPEPRFVSRRTIAFRKLCPEAVAPSKAFPFDAGWDLTSTEEAIIEAGGVIPIKTGISIAIPEGYAGMIAERSGLGKKGVAVRGGVIDSGYRGELIVLMHNLGRNLLHIMPGMRVAQLVIYPICLDVLEETDTLPEADRGDRGFGSTGV